MSLRFCFNCNFLQQYFQISFLQILLRDGSRTAATSKMECLVIIVNLPAVTYYHKALPAVYYYHKALHLAASLDPPLLVINSCPHIALFFPLRLTSFSKFGFDREGYYIYLPLSGKTFLPDTN